MVNFRNNTKPIINLEYSAEKISNLKKKERGYVDTILYEKIKMPPMPKTTLMTTGSIYYI